MARIRILHVSTVHPPNDPRVAHRVIPTLAPHYELIALLPNAPSGRLNGARFIPLPFFRRVLVRLFVSHPLVVWYAIRLRPVLLHIYDPELLPVARLIQWLFGIRVIYEVHENLYKKFSLKTVNRGLVLERAFWWFDQMAQRHFHLIFTEHGYRDTYTNVRRPSAVIYNFPRLDLIDPYKRPYGPDAQQPTLFYIGRISLERAFDTLVEGLAMLTNRYPKAKLHLFGECTVTDQTMEKLPGYRSVQNNVVFHGYTDQHAALPRATGAIAGVALLKPVGDYTESYPTKLFEYMALGLPVITADFRLYREVVERHKCGFCIDPTDAKRLAEVLTFLIEHPTEAGRMGQRGREAVEAAYNWASEARKLLAFYDNVLS